MTRKTKYVLAGMSILSLLALITLKVRFDREYFRKTNVAPAGDDTYILLGEKHNTIILPDGKRWVGSVTGTSESVILHSNEVTPFSWASALNSEANIIIFKRDRAYLYNLKKLRGGYYIY